MSTKIKVSTFVGRRMLNMTLAIFGAFGLAGALHAQTFSNPATITIPSSGPATPYPSTITVSGLSGTLTNISVALNDYNHTFPDDVDVLLVGPAGTGAQSVVLMSDVGGSTDAINVNLVIQDGAPAMPDSTAITSGTYAPTNFGTGDPFAAPAPAGPHGATFASMGLIGGPASAANGTWSLYVVDDLGGDSGSFNGGWSITFTVTAPPQFAYTPAPSSTVTATGGTTIGSTGTLTITPSIGTPGSGSGAPATTTTTCTAPTAPFAGFGQTVTAVGSGPISGGPLSGTCTLGVAAATQTLTCTENRGGTPIARTWTLSCPAGTLLPLTSTPVSGSTITLPTQNLGGPATTATVQFQNPNPVAVTVTCTAPAAPQFTVSPLTINVPANGNASTTISYSSTTAGSFTGTLNCSAGTQSFTFTLNGTTIAPPQFAYTPAPGSTVTATGGTTIGSTGTLTITPSIGTPGFGTGTAATTTTTCTAPTAPFAGFGQTVTAVGSGPISGGPLSGTCTLGASAVTQTLTCTENRGSTPIARTWTLSCPAGTLLPLTSTPVSGSTITLPTHNFGAPPTTATVQFQNPNPVAVTVTCTAPTPTQFSASPLTINVPANGNASTTISYSATLTGQFNGTMTCTSGSQTFTFALIGRTFVALSAIDTLSTLGKWLMLLGVLGIGLLAVRRL